MKRVRAEARGPGRENLHCGRQVVWFGDRPLWPTHDAYRARDQASQNWRDSRKDKKGEEVDELDAFFFHVFTFLATVRALQYPGPVITLRIQYRRHI